MHRCIRNQARCLRQTHISSTLVVFSSIRTGFGTCAKSLRLSILSGHRDDLLTRPLPKRSGHHSCTVTINFGIGFRLYGIRLWPPTRFWKWGGNLIELIHLYFKTLPRSYLIEGWRIKWWFSCSRACYFIQFTRAVRKDSAKIAYFFNSCSRWFERGSS